MHANAADVGYPGCTMQICRRLLEQFQTLVRTFLQTIPDRSLQCLSAIRSAIQVHFPCCLINPDFTPACFSSMTLFRLSPSGHFERFRDVQMPFDGHKIPPTRLRMSVSRLIPPQIPPSRGPSRQRRTRAGLAVTKTQAAGITASVKSQHLQTHTRRLPPWDPLQTTI
jgi:hypothetical protein